ncbi:DNA mismatch repair endonuclease MutL [Treponema sp. J25]|uniref:DNA mismatch repair endonuclease MutL n=1 Tax=Treponema sp. J25 TaxID=2094121 RepID=UPI00104A659C|nr:DNA mismatch repair endonuclease MutL [Treponema sp. J25]TCW62504.1 DNA mismatch repair protein MutL [Treponema sp. J25]
MSKPEKGAPSGSTIHVLAPEVAQRIAAGEVIDRPAAVVRELMDNALDAKSQRIDVAISGGGSDLIEVIDDGIGMVKEDLQLCWLPHATSKIQSLEDLEHTTTLGFRGEALAAIAAVSRLEITSSDGNGAWQLEIGPLTRSREEPILRPVQRNRGTTVRVRALFETVPARKKFLKRPPAEAQLCYQVWCDKALAFPEREFRFLQEGALKTLLPAVGGYRERFSQILLSEREKPFLHEVYGSGDGFSVHIIIGGPELYRSDRRNQFVFANHRRIQEYALLQALEYGCQGFFPNGTHPVGALFIDIDPALADFNIHPAKREVRFKDPAAIHHTITRTLQDFFGRHVLYVQGGTAATTGSAPAEQVLFEASPPFHKEKAPSSFLAVQSTEKTDASGFSGHGKPEEGGERFFSSGRTGKGDPFIRAEQIEQFLARSSSFAPLPGKEQEKTALSGEDFRYLGQLFNLFLIVEKDDTLYLIDQHAAHERILFNELQDRPPPPQELLVPLPFTTDTETVDAFLTTHRQELAHYGLVITPEAPGTWLLEALPSCWKLSPEKTIEHLLSMPGEKENFTQRWIATLACHSAIQDGEILDDRTAQALAAAALELPEPRCPHGRPIWIRLSREDLFKMVRRLE